MNLVLLPIRTDTTMKRAQTPIAQWLIEQCDNYAGGSGITMRQASLRAGLNHSAINRFVHGTQPDPDSCYKLAAFFGVPPEKVLHLAGHLKELPRNHSYELADAALRKRAPELYRLLDQAIDELGDEGIEALKIILKKVMGMA